ncbi:MAG: glycosyltransferase family 9 protein [Bacteroidia bacterium]|nr:glycosyltransferase family 9 protein [Bacteroidia bacterium]
MKRFLIIQTAFTGDVILATVVIEKLHKFYPDAEIDFLLRKGNESLLTNHPFIHEILIWNKKNKKYKGLLQIIRKIRKIKYDHVINLQRFISTGLITVFSNAKTTTGFDKNPLSRLFSFRIPHLISHGIHETERNQSLIENITDKTLVKPRLYPGSTDYSRVSKYKTGTYICIAPASVWFTKQYPVAKWVEFLNILPAHYMIYLIGGKEDSRICESILKLSSNKNIINLAGELSFLETAALMQEATMNYTNDSAPAHIASAMNASVSVIFLSTVPDFGFGPLSDNAHIIEIKRELPCRPCGLHGLKACPIGTFECAHSIEPYQLMDVLPKP